MPEVFAFQFSTLHHLNERFVSLYQCIDHCRILSFYGLCQLIIDPCLLPRSPISYEACHRAISYMCLHFTEPLSLSSVARAVGMHPVTLSKLFADRLGLYFHSYLQYLRCSHALGLIRGGNATLTEVAYSAGFGSIRSFNRAFLAVYGKRPSDYRCEPNDNL